MERTWLSLQYCKIPLVSADVEWPPQCQSLSPNTKRTSDQSKVEPFKLNLRAKITVTHHDQVLSQTTKKLVLRRAGPTRSSQKVV